MKTFEKFYNTNEPEDLFLELSHLDELEIKFELIYFKNCIFYFDDKMNRELFRYDKKYNTFDINYLIWYEIESRYVLDNSESEDFMDDMIYKYFNKRCVVKRNYEWLRLSKNGNLMK